MFTLHPQLAQDTISLGSLTLCEVLLMNDSQYPWLILVPKRENIREIYQLSDMEQQLLIKESSFVAKTLQTLFQADKINVAALGNMVPQLHIHHIARFTTDLAWPKPIWGVVPSQAYERDALSQRVMQLKHELNLV